MMATTVSQINRGRLMMDKKNRWIKTFSILIVLCLTWNIGQAETIQYNPVELKGQLAAALAAKGKNYQPRTEHLLPDGRPRYVNRLILEDSPYLIQHAHNPVHWFAWGEAAFAKAKSENKPVFLSIGYSTCHWCHVMERESFDNPEIAEILNKHYISIKVDREQHPDVDDVYMSAVQMITGRGGWPMSSFLTPDGNTFVGGSYFPPQQFRDLLLKVNDLWSQQHPLVIAQAEKVRTAVARINQSSKQALTVDDKIVRQALRDIMARYDRVNGGFGQAPKFPNETWLLYLLELALRSDDSSVIQAIEHTLQAMAQGGIYDQIGGGFHRYATDSVWLIPHFEKMLYNQALLARVYLYAYRLTGNQRYAQIADQTLNYVLREMQSSQGAFYSASDADSKEGEGIYFLWSEQQVKDALPADLAKQATAFYGITGGGNFEGSNILHQPVAAQAFAEQQQLSTAEFDRQLTQIRSQLLKRREQRTPPFRDEKILTAWNAMMINTLVIAAETLQQPAYLTAAERAANFIWQYNRQESARLSRINVNGRASIAAVQEDYAYLAEAFLQLYDSTGKAVWLERAQAVTDTMLEQFWDSENGGFYMNPASTADPIMVRPKSSRDSAIPSANAVALRVLAKLSRRSANLLYQKKAEATLAAFSSNIVASPISHAAMLMAANELHNGESGPRQFAAKGAVAVDAELDQQNRLRLDIAIKPGWHINSHQPLQDYLIATDVELDPRAGNRQLSDIRYPQPIVKTLGFQRETLSLYENRIQLEAKLSQTGGDNRPLSLLLKLQACDDKICLPPEQLRLNVPMPH